MSANQYPGLPYSLATELQVRGRVRCQSFQSLESEDPEYYFSALLVKASHQSSPDLSGGEVDHLPIWGEAFMLRGETNCWLPCSEAPTSSQPLLPPPPAPLLYPMRDIKDISIFRSKDDHENIPIFHLLSQSLYINERIKVTPILSFSALL